MKIETITGVELMRTVTCESLPTFEAVTGVGRAAARRAALLELYEVRELLRTPSPLLASPRMRRRYNEAVAWAAMYRTNDTTQ